MDKPLTSQRGHTSPAILMEGVSVVYRRALDLPTSMREHVVQAVRGGLLSSTLRAHDGATIAIEHGEVFGIVGRNGAGKTTLLRAGSRIIRPTEGRVRVWGVTAPLLGVGARFNADLTGRENASVCFSILGRRRSLTAALMGKIIDFSELGDYFASPVRAYSQGRVVRLGFALAMAVRPELLLVDEVLAFGDEAFRERCARRFEESRQAGTTILAVTHNLSSVEAMCGLAAWLNRGVLQLVGECRQVVDEYRRYKETALGAPQAGHEAKGGEGSPRRQKSECVGW